MTDLVLVTGASGFLGRHLVRRLLAESPTTRLVAQHTPTSTLEPEHDRVVPLPALLADLPDALRSAGLRERFRAVFHLAASTPKTSGGEVVPDVLDANVMGTQAVLDAVAGRTNRLLFASTIDVYAPSDGLLSESSPVEPVSVYAASKLMGEALVTHWGRRSDTPVHVLRVGHLYGPGELAYRKLIPVAIQSALAGEPMIQYGSGQARRDLLYVEDAARLMCRALMLDTNASDGPTNLVAGRSYSVAEILARIGSIAGGDVAIEERPSDVAASSLEFDASRVRALLPMDGYVSIDEGIRHELEWFKGVVSE